ncbi:MAG: hypothetical protein LBV51_05025 [Acholeplasmatales bacterium]|jgi:hypothetical protein|nr:hypothetical protein [Acholeplasmatales bacterium]
MTDYVYVNSILNTRISNLITNEQLHIYKKDLLSGLRSISYSNGKDLSSTIENTLYDEKAELYLIFDSDSFIIDYLYLSYDISNIVYFLLYKKDDNFSKLSSLSKEEVKNLVLGESIHNKPWFNAQLLKDSDINNFITYAYNYFSSLLKGSMKMFYEYNMVIKNIELYFSSKDNRYNTQLINYELNDDVISDFCRDILSVKNKDISKIESLCYNKLLSSIEEDNYSYLVKYTILKNIELKKIMEFSLESEII